MPPSTTTETLAMNNLPQLKTLTPPAEAPLKNTHSSLVGVPHSADSAILEDASALMRKYMAPYDTSHDDLHIERVVNMARRLALSIPGTDVLVVELGAMFHDMIDHKYVSPEQQEERLREVSKLMERHGMSQERIDTVLKIVKNTGYSIEKRLRAAGQWTPWHNTCNEFHCVQDADRLDAVGALGILRVAGFATAHNSPLYHDDPSVDSAYQHFFDKLLHMRNTLKTPLGRKVADRRQQLMEQFVKCAKDEVDLNDFVDPVSA